MQAIRAKIRGVLAAFLGLSIMVWSVMPSFAHAPNVFETIQDHLEMVEDHGHSHGFDEDLFWAMHGHDHDVSDHDHSHAFLMKSPHAEHIAAFGAPWRSTVSVSGPFRQFRLERPPRS